MKKINKKGFTLIELLAVIVIMGILMAVAIPAVALTIENARKDAFIDTAKSYLNAAKTMWDSDNFVCGTDNVVPSALSGGSYYIEINTKKSNAPTLLDSGGKSSWGNRDVAGYIKVYIGKTIDHCTRNKNNPNDPYKKICPENKPGYVCVPDDNWSLWTDCSSKNAVVVKENMKFVKFNILLVDGIHGIIGTGAGKESSDLSREDITMKGAKYVYAIINSGLNMCVEN